VQMGTLQPAGVFGQQPLLWRASNATAVV